LLLSNFFGLILFNAAPTSLYYHLTVIML
jgi:hypothetical protein